MGRTTIEDQGDRLHTTAFGFHNDARFKKGAKVEEALARVALTVDEPISNTQSCHQMQSSTPMVAWGLIHRMLADGRVRSLLCLSRLNRGFLIRA
jgi:hypothetical protein